MNNYSKLQKALEFALAHRPKIGGFPFLAECLKQAGVTKNIWSLPSAQSVYIMNGESIVQQGTPLINGLHNIPPFNQENLVTALRTDQAGKNTFPEFLSSAWKAGVVSYMVDFHERTVTYFGVNQESYRESYPAVLISGLDFEE